LAASQFGEVIRLEYLIDLSPEFAERLGGDQTDSYATAWARQWLRSPQARPHLREMQSWGTVSVGRCAGWTYCPI